MEVNEALAIMNSDYKLWEHAETEEHGEGRVTKTLSLPWDIGEVSVTLEGISNAQQRRAAVSSFGEYIRGVIDERINDDAITARAQSAALRSEQASREDSPEVSGGERVRESAVQEEPDAKAGEAHEGPATKPIGLRETLLARRAEINDDAEYYVKRRDDAERELRALARDLKAVDAGLSTLGDDDDDA